MPRFYKEDVWPVVVMIVVAAAAAIAIFLWLDSSNRTTYAAPAFDHSQCQYPERQSNPPDGCDNSDPARPECMKIGIEDCDLPRFDGSMPTKSDNVAPAASESVTQPKSSTCAEK